MRDLQSNIAVVQAVTPQIMTATQTSAAIDLQNVNQAVAVISTGAIVGAGNVTPKLTECDTSGGTYTDVTAVDLNGTFPAVLLTGTVIDVGYNGNKRFIKVVLTFNSGTSVAASATVITGQGGRVPM